MSPAVPGRFRAFRAEQASSLLLRNVMEPAGRSRSYLRVGSGGGAAGVWRTMGPNLMAKMRAYSYISLNETDSGSAQIALMARSDEHAIATGRVLHSFYGWRSGFEIRDGQRQVYRQAVEIVKAR